MHTLPWEMKRSHWGLTWTAIRTFRNAAERLDDSMLADMTPARFDILFILWQRPAWFKRPANEPYTMTLKELTTRLGLHPTTVWKCVKRMEELGFLRRQPHEPGSRRVEVQMTNAGLDAFELAAATERGVPFLEQNRYFAERVRLARARRRRIRRGRFPRPTIDRSHGVIDTVLRAFAYLLRICAQGHGSWSFPVYDPTFDDHVFRVRYGYRPDTPEGWGR